MLTRHRYTLHHLPDIPINQDHAYSAPDDRLCYAVVDKFQDGCGQTIEAYKKYQEAVTELAEVRQELADASSALAQAQHQIKLLKQRLVDPFASPHLPDAGIHPLVCLSLRVARSHLWLRMK